MEIIQNNNQGLGNEYSISIDINNVDIKYIFTSCQKIGKWLQDKHLLLFSKKENILTIVICFATYEEIENLKNQIK